MAALKEKTGGVPQRKRVNKPLNEQKNYLSALFESLTTAIFADDLFIHSPHCSPLSLSGLTFSCRIGHRVRKVLATHSHEAGKRRVTLHPPPQ